MSLNPALTVPGVVLVLASAFDLRTREIPDAFPLALLAWSVASRLFGFQPATWFQLETGLVPGLAVGLAVGLFLFRVGALGGGDAKLLAALGACLGPLAFGIAFAWIGLVGGVLALAAHIRRRREVVYGPALAIGYLLAVTIT